MDTSSFVSMPEPARIRFGLFDFDPDTLELRRDGVVVKLQSQPARVLALLLAQPGEVITRETMRQAVWGGETHVDFDRGLNFCVAQIRSALGDSADSPRFIKTLPKRGYQFIAPVSAPAPIPEAPAPPVPVNRRRYLWFAVPAAAAAVAGGYFLLRKTAIRVAVARFDNLTGNPAFDTFAETLADAVIAELTISGADRVAVIGNDPMLRQRRRLRDVPAIGAALQVRYVVLGSLERNAAGVHLFAQLIRLPDQAHVGVTRLPTGAEDPLQARPDLAQRLAKLFTPRLI